ncbi:MAG: CoA pyrophosphatase [Acidobacteriota bacterium]
MSDESTSSPEATPQITPASWIIEARLRFEQPAPRRLPPSDVRQAAVLVPLYVEAGQLWTLLTRRSEQLPTHRGQIAFPGGGVEPGEDSWQAALREANEEIGLDGGRVLRLGELDESETPSGFRIVPCVAAVPFPLETRVNPDEIDEVFPVPLQALTDPRLVEDREVLIDEVPRTLRIYHVGRAQIWGLTARILQNLLHRLGLSIVEQDA